MAKLKNSHNFLINNNQDNVKTNFFLSEIDINKKTIEAESTKNNKKI